MKKYYIVGFIIGIIMFGATCFANPTNDTNKPILIAKIIDDDFTLDMDLDINSKKQIRPKATIVENFKSESTTKCVEKIMVPHLKKQKIEREMFDDMDNIDVDHVESIESLIGTRVGVNKKKYKLSDNKKERVNNIKKPQKVTKKSTEKGVNNIKKSQQVTKKTEKRVNDIQKPQQTVQNKKVKESNNIKTTQTKPVKDKKIIVKDTKNKTVEVKNKNREIQKQTTEFNPAVYTEEDSTQNMPEYSFDTIYNRMPLTRGGFDEW